MGLFDKLLSKEATEKLNSFVKEATEKINKELDGLREGAEKKPADAPKPEAAKPAETPAPAAAASSAAPEAELDENGYPVWQTPVLKKDRKGKIVTVTDFVPSDITDRSDPSYIVDLVEKNLPGAAAKKEVPLSEITSDVPEKNMPISVMVSVGGVNKVAVMVVEKNKYRNAAVVNTMNACEDKGIAAIRVFKEFENKPEFVLGRIKAFL